jgi:hypothetical protein
MISCEDLGLSKQELIAMVVDRACKDLLNQHVTETDEEGEEYAYDTSSPLATELKEAIKERLDAAINKIGDEYMSKRIEEHLREMLMQETNKWGEPRSEPMTVREYFEKRAEQYLLEKVDYDGKTDRGGYGSFRPMGNRITYAVHQHFQYHIENTVKEMLKNANGILVGGIQKAVEAKLDEVSKALKVEVKVPR